MAVGADTCADLKPIAGVKLGYARAGIRYAGRKDLVLVELAQGANVAGVFTRNAFCAAPVTLAKNNLAQGDIRYLIINTGNANAGTGEQGMKDALSCCQAVAEATGVSSRQVLPFSTGVIGERLPVQRIIDAIPLTLESLTAEGWRDAADSILTTDTRAKGVSVTVEGMGSPVTITGIAKGSGMIRPDMATMLAFIATDAAVAPEILEQAVQSASAKSFNRITVDGDTSTNDACMLIATGQAQSPLITSVADPAYEIFLTALTRVCVELAQAIVRDGEGATKFVTVRVCEGNSSEECLAVAYTIAHSPLVKTAFFASDPNWGRILAAVGRAGLKDFDVNGVSLFLNNLCIAENGGLAAGYTEAQGKLVMAGEEIEIHVRLGRGECEEIVWTTDLSKDYVSINADYRS